MASRAKQLDGSVRIGLGPVRYSRVFANGKWRFVLSPPDSRDELLFFDEKELEVWNLRRELDVPEGAEQSFPCT